METGTSSCLLPRPRPAPGYAQPWSVLTLSNRARRDGRSANGTLTFRRSSTTPANQGQAASETPIHSNPADNAAPQSVAALLAEGSTRYSRDQLLDIYKAQVEPRSRDLDVSDLYMQGWNPGHVNGTSRSSWGKNEGYVPQDPGVCWDSSGQVKPLGLHQMTQEEKEACRPQPSPQFPTNPGRGRTQSPWTT